MYSNQQIQKEERKICNNSDGASVLTKTSLSKKYKLN